MIRLRPRSRGPAPDQPTPPHTSAGPTDPQPDEPRRSWLPARRDAAPRPGPGSPSDEDLALKPSAMRGNEALYGYVVALELIAVSILNLTVTHGTGAPKHPATALAAVGLVASIALVPIIRTRHRMIVPLAAIAAAFFVTLPAVPNSVREAHILALIIPVIYAFILTQRQRRATTALGRAGRSSPGKAASKSAPAPRRAADGNRRRGRKQGQGQTGPAASRRYTPPKPKRPRPAAPADEGRKRRSRPTES